MVIQLIVETPGELAVITKFQKHKKSRRLLFRHLRGLGWSLGRVLEAFHEITEALG